MFAIDKISAVINVYGGALPVAFLMAITFALFGIFVVLKRMVFIGVTLSEVAACGVAFALIHELPPFLGAAIFCLAVVAILAYPYELSKLPRDTVLGTIFICASGMGILLVARSGFGLEKVKAILYGNLLFASTNDVITICAVMIPALLILMFFFRPILYSFLDRESAHSLGIKVWRYELLFFVFLGLIVAAASRIAGVMLVFCFLVVPAATSLLISRKMLPVMILACFFAVISTVFGIMTSYQADLPPNQLIAVISCCFFVIAMLYNHVQKIWKPIYANSISLILCLMLVLGLSELKVEADFSDGISLSGKENMQSTQSNPVADAEPLQNWVEIIEEVEKVSLIDKREGIQKAQKALLMQPPSYFAEQLQEIIAKNLAKAEPLEQ